MYENAQMRGVEVGDAEMCDQALPAQALEFEHRIHIAGMVEPPPVKLQQIDAVDAKPVEPFLHPGANRFGGHPRRFRHPFREDRRS